MQNLIYLALETAIKAHGKTKGKDDRLYIMHPIWVADNVKTDEEKIVALLHDVVEDTKWTLDQLANEGFPKNIIKAVDAVTYRKGENRYAYLSRCKANPIAKQVKLADLRHNSDLTRLPIVTQRDIDRHVYYQQNIAFMLDMTGDERDGLWHWKYGAFDIYQTAPRNPDGTYGPWFQYIVTHKNAIIATKYNLCDAVMSLSHYDSALR